MAFLPSQYIFSLSDLDKAAYVLSQDLHQIVHGKFSFKTQVLHRETGNMYSSQSVNLENLFD